MLKDANFRNAAATRGNHIFIWTAMIDYTKNNDELAAILAHEVGHVLARHTDTDPNDALRKAIVGIGAQVIGIATANVANAQIAGQLASQVSSEVGKGLIVNPYSQKREEEADYVGLFLMADAKYDPTGAITFWDRASKDPNFGSSMPSFFSTHPPAKDRQSYLKKLLPQAKLRYQQALGNIPRPTIPNKQTVSKKPIKTQGSSNEWALPSKRFKRNWTVKGSKAVLYSQTSTRSKPIGEFRKNARIYGAPIDSKWIAVERPDKGYVRRSDLR